jgi:hypothetical protein
LPDKEHCFSSTSERVFAKLDEEEGEGGKGGGVGEGEGKEGTEEEKNKKKKKKKKACSFFCQIEVSQSVSSAGMEGASVEIVTAIPVTPPPPEFVNVSLNCASSQKLGKYVMGDELELSDPGMVEMADCCDGKHIVRTGIQLYIVIYA